MPSDVVQDPTAQEVTPLCAKGLSVNGGHAKETLAGHCAGMRGGLAASSL